MKTHHSFSTEATKMTPRDPSIVSPWEGTPDPEARHTAALTAARVGAFEWRPGHGQVSLDNCAAAACGIRSRGEAIPDFAWLANFCDESREALMEAAAGPQHPHFTLEVRLARAHGKDSDGWLEVRAGAHREGEPASTVVRGLLLPIDNRKAREAEVAQLEEGRIQFLGQFAHELRSPLSAVRMVSDLLSFEEARDPMLARTMPILRRQTTRLTRLVDRLQDVSRISRGKFDVELAPMDLRAVLAHIVSDRHAEAVEKGVKLSVTIGDDAIPIRGDEGRLAEVFDNLMSNALAATEEGDSIEVHTSRVGKDVLIKVIDSGRGIPPARLPKIFLPFQHCSDDSQRRAGSLGMGLALVCGIVAAHGGAVSASSQGPGRGAEFVVRLPS